MKVKYILSGYIVSILLIIFLIARAFIPAALLLAAFLVERIIRKRKEALSLQLSASIYTNITNRSLIFVPHGFDKDGVRTDINKPIILKEPYTSEDVGVALRKCFGISSNGRYTIKDLKGHPALEAAGYKNGKKFIMDHKMQTVFFQRIEGYEFIAADRAENWRGYIRKNTFTPTLPKKASDTELGEAIHKVFNECN
ncbi:hypothetical protein [Bacillus sp. EB01]|uniref:hypothetical protein n=1 Tax=Bacillus sp. EB01 TaxID=1347086 RepID=UPI0005C68791|nr:hypothetical protein [Bacillus sp. EB01]